MLYHLLVVNTSDAYFYSARGKGAEAFWTKSQAFGNFNVVVVAAPVPQQNGNVLSKSRGKQIFGGETANHSHFWYYLYFVFQTITTSILGGNPL